MVFGHFLMHSEKNYLVVGKIMLAAIDFKVTTTNCHTIPVGQVPHAYGVVWELN